MRLRESGINIYKAKVATILIVFVMVGVLICNRAYSQGNIPPGNIHLGPLKINPSFGERLEYDDNAFQVSGKGTGPGGLRERKRSDIINIITPGLKLDLPFKGGGFIPGTEHNLSIDWHTDILNYRDNANQNQQNNYFLASGSFMFPRGFGITMRDRYVDASSPSGGETDNIHKRKTHDASITVNMPDYFRKYDAEITYRFKDQEYDERSLLGANRFNQSFTLKVPYKVTPKIHIFPEYTYGWIEYDSKSLAGAQSDLHYNTIYAGTEWYATAKTTGILKLGFSRLDYDTAPPLSEETSSLNTFVAKLGVKIDLTSRMSMNINAGRGPTESEFTSGSSSHEKTSGDISISRRVWKELTVSVKGGYDKLVFHGSERKDDVYKLDVSSRYVINRWVYADFKFSHKDKRVNVDTSADRINKASLGINILF
jgi:hypothetical protein